MIAILTAFVLYALIVLTETCAVASADEGTSG